MKVIIRGWKAHLLDMPQCKQSNTDFPVHHPLLKKDVTQGQVMWKQENSEFRGLVTVQNYIKGIFWKNEYIHIAYYEIGKNQDNDSNHSKAMHVLKFPIHLYANIASI